MVLVSLVVLFSPSTPSVGGIVGLDKVVHASLFGALAACTSWRFGRGLVLVLGYAVVSEVLQATLPIARTGDPLDAIADGAGAALGWLLTSRHRGAKAPGRRTGDGAAAVERTPRRTPADGETAGPSG